MSGWDAAGAAMTDTVGGADHQGMSRFGAAGPNVSFRDTGHNRKLTMVF